MSVKKSGEIRPFYAIVPPWGAICFQLAGLNPSQNSGIAHEAMLRHITCGQRPLLLFVDLSVASSHSVKPSSASLLPKDTLRATELGGGPAIIAADQRTLDLQLCVPTFRWVCS
jgi:hypothetical protein